MRHDSCIAGHATRAERRSPIKTLVGSLVAAAAITAGVLLLRQQQKPAGEASLKQVPAGETVPRTVSQERLRELGY